MTKIKKNGLTIITALLLLFTYCATTSCTKSPSTVDDSIIQVWEKNDETGQLETLLSYGVVIGDGNQALTIIDFSMYSPVNLEIISDIYGKRKASIQAIDSRTNMTLLKYEGNNIPAVIIGDIDTTIQGQAIFIRGWEDEKSNYVKIASTVSTYQNLLPLGFLIDYIDYPEVVVDKPGAVITDNEGKVLGLMDCYHYSASYLGLPGMYFFPPIININNGLELSSPQADQQPWANGPILFFYRNYGSDIPGYGNYDGLIKNYLTLALITEQNLNRMGNALPSYEFPETYEPKMYPSEIRDGPCVTIVFPRSKTLRNPEGGVLAIAKWIGIYWNRGNGKPDILYYGNTPYKIEGGFEVPEGVIPLPPPQLE